MQLWWCPDPSNDQSECDEPRPGVCFHAALSTYLPRAALELPIQAGFEPAPRWLQPDVEHLVYRISNVWRRYTKACATARARKCRLASTTAAWVARCQDVRRSASLVSRVAVKRRAQAAATFIRDWRRLSFESRAMARRMGAAARRLDTWRAEKVVRSWAAHAMAESVSRAAVSRADRWQTRRLLRLVLVHGFGAAVRAWRASVRRGAMLDVQAEGRGASRTRQWVVTVSRAWLLEARRSGVRRRRCRCILHRRAVSHLRNTLRSWRYEVVKVTRAGYRVLKVWQRRADATAARHNAAVAMAHRHERARVVQRFKMWRKAARSTAANAQREIVAGAHFGRRVARWVLREWARRARIGHAVGALATESLAITFTVLIARTFASWATLARARPRWNLRNAVARRRLEAFGGALAGASMRAALRSCFAFWADRAAYRRAISNAAVRIKQRRARRLVATATAAWRRTHALQVALVCRADAFRHVRSMRSMATAWRAHTTEAVAGRATAAAAAIIVEATAAAAEEEAAVRRRQWLEWEAHVREQDKELDRMKHALELTKSDTLANQARPHAHTRAETPTLSPSASPARQQPGQPSLTASPRTGQRDGISPWTPVPLAASSLSPFSSPALVARTRGDEGGAGDAEAGGGVIARGVGEIAGGMGMGFIGAPPHCSVDSPFGDTDATSNRGPGRVVGLNQITDDSSLNAPAGVLTTVLSSDPAGSAAAAVEAAAAAEDAAELRRAATAARDSAAAAAVRETDVRDKLDTVEASLRAVLRESLQLRADAEVARADADTALAALAAAAADSSTRSNGGGSGHGGNGAGSNNLRGRSSLGDSPEDSPEDEESDDRSLPDDGSSTGLRAAFESWQVRETRLMEQLLEAQAAEVAARAKVTAVEEANARLEAEAAAATKTAAAWNVLSTHSPLLLPSEELPPPFARDEAKEKEAVEEVKGEGEDPFEFRLLGASFEEQVDGGVNSAAEAVRAAQAAEKAADDAAAEAVAARAAEAAEKAAEDAEAKVAADRAAYVERFEELTERAEGAEKQAADAISETARLRELVSPLQFAAEAAERSAKQLADDVEAVTEALFSSEARLAQLMAAANERKLALEAQLAEARATNTEAAATLRERMGLLNSSGSKQHELEVRLATVEASGEVTALELTRAAAELDRVRDAHTVAATEAAGLKARLDAVAAQSAELIRVRSAHVAAAADAANLRAQLEALRADTATASEVLRGDNTRVRGALAACEARCSDLAAQLSIWVKCGMELISTPGGQPQAGTSSATVADPPVGSSGWYASFDTLDTLETLNTLVPLQDIRSLPPSTTGTEARASGGGGSEQSGLAAATRAAHMAVAAAVGGGTPHATHTTPPPPRVDLLEQHSTPRHSSPSPTRPTWNFYPSGSGHWMSPQPSSRSYQRTGGGYKPGSAAAERSEAVARALLAQAEARAKELQLAGDALREELAQVTAAAEAERGGRREDRSRAEAQRLTLQRSAEEERATLEGSLQEERAARGADHAAAAREASLLAAHANQLRAALEEVLREERAARGDDNATAAQEAARLAVRAAELDAETRRLEDLVATVRAAGDAAAGAASTASADHAATVAAVAEEKSRAVRQLAEAREAHAVEQGGLQAQLAEAARARGEEVTIL